jgi:hypothetical protein
MKERLLRYYVKAFRLFVPLSSLMWVGDSIADLDCISNDWSRIVILLVIAVYIGSYLLIWSGRKP